MAGTAVHREYQFGPFHLDARERRLSRDGEVIPLRLKVFDTLVVLVPTAQWAGEIRLRERELLRALADRAPASRIARLRCVPSP